MFPSSDAESERLAGAGPSPGMLEPLVRAPVASEESASETAVFDTAVPDGAVSGGVMSDSAVFEETVTLPANLHARPAGKLAQAASRFRGTTIRVRHGGKSVDPAGVLAVMSLGATAGTAVTVRAEGPDAEQAVRVLTEVLSQAE